MVLSRACVPASQFDRVSVLGRLRQQGVHVGPELLPLAAFLSGHLGEGSAFANRRQVCIGLPAHEFTHCGCDLLLVPLGDAIGPGGEIGAEPRERPGAKRSALPVIWPRHVLTVTTSGHGSAARGPITV